MIQKDKNGKEIHTQITDIIGRPVAIGDIVYRSFSGRGASGEVNIIVNIRDSGANKIAKRSNTKSGERWVSHHNMIILSAPKFILKNETEDEFLNRMAKEKWEIQNFSFKGCL